MRDDYDEEEVFSEDVLNSISHVSQNET